MIFYVVVVSVIILVKVTYYAEFFRTVFVCWSKDVIPNFKFVFVYS